LPLSKSGFRQYNPFSKACRSLCAKTIEIGINSHLQASSFVFFSLGLLALLPHIAEVEEVIVI
jgi:hypothetical protein